MRKHIRLIFEKLKNIIFQIKYIILCSWMCYIIYNFIIYHYVYNLNNIHTVKYSIIISSLSLINSVYQQTLLEYIMRKCIFLCNTFIKCHLHFPGLTFETSWNAYASHYANVKSNKIVVFKFIVINFTSSEQSLHEYFK